MRAVPEVKKWSRLDTRMIRKVYGITAVTSFAMRAFPVPGMLRSCRRVTGNVGLLLLSLLEDGLEMAGV